MKKQHWKRKGRYFEFDCNDAQAIIFGAPLPHSMWAWAVWASRFKAEGVEFGLAGAKRQANEKLDIVLGIAGESSDSGQGPRTVSAEAVMSRK